MVVTTPAGRWIDLTQASSSSRPPGSSTYSVTSGDRDTSVLQDGTSDTPWYRTVAKYMSKGGHPYTCEAISFPTVSKEGYARFDDVKFWPFPGPLRPPGKPDIDGWDWSEYENTIAICTKGKVTVGRCTPDNPWSVVTVLRLPHEHFYTLAWSYNPITFHPILAIAGNGASVTIIDMITKCVFRVLKGHGGDIFWLCFHPIYPHILASTSYDKTIRIWNILGADKPPCDPGDKPNENYPQGDADEGTAIVAILVGEGEGGHRSFVTGAAFHPTKNAIATCGMDRHVKIWPLPRFPIIVYPPPPTPKGYRPILVFFPLFSTTRLFDDYTDWIDWMSEDILVTRGRQQLATWRWIGYQRYFRPGSVMPLSIVPIVSDYQDSGSYTLLTRYSIGPDCWAASAGLHRAFNPKRQNATSTTLVLDEDELDPQICTDPLIAVAAHRSNTAPEILLINPLLAEEWVEGMNLPMPVRRLREDYTKGDGKDPDDELFARDEVRGANPDFDEIGNGREIESLAGATEAGVKAIGSEKEGKREKSPNHEKMSESWNPTKEPWRLVVSGWPSLLSKPTRALLPTPKGKGKGTPTPKSYRRKIEPSIYNLVKVAISPRGAQWIVGVGEQETIFVFQRGADQSNRHGE